MRSVMCAAACLLASVANAEEVGREQFNATLWMQNAPEYRASAEQVYRLATERIANPGPGTAALEQLPTPADQLARLPTAVVLDLDETVLDNTVYQARLIRDQAPYTTKTWGEWEAAGCGRWGWRPARGVSRGW